MNIYLASSQISKKKFVRHFLFLFCFMFLNTNYLQTSFFSCMSVLFFNSPLPQIDKSSGFLTFNNKQISWPTSLVIQIPTCFCVTTKAVLLRVFLLRCAEEVLIATDGVQILRICKQYWFRHHWHPCKPMYAGLYQIDITLSSLDKISNDTTTDDEQGTYVI